MSMMGLEPRSLPTRAWVNWLFTLCYGWSGWHGYSQGQACRRQWVKALWMGDHLLAQLVKQALDLQAQGGRAGLAPRLVPDPQTCSYAQGPA